MKGAPLSKTPLSQEEIQLIQQYKVFADQNQYYAILQVRRQSTDEEIQEAFYRQSRKWHPDRYFRKDIGEYATDIDAIFEAITMAYNTLIDAKKRSAYDRTQNKSTSSTTESTPNVSTPNVSTPNVANEGFKYPSHRRKRRDPNREPRERIDISEALKQNRQNKVLNAIQQQNQEQKDKAQRLYQEAMDAYNNGDVLKAATNLHIACKMEPKNQNFMSKYKIIRKEARIKKANDFFAQAENAETYQNYARAIEQYKKAVEYECEDARAYARLAYLLDKLDPDPREILRLLQVAVQKDPNNVEYRCTLGEAYRHQGLMINAKQEYTKALALDKNCVKAKDALKEF